MSRRMEKNLNSHNMRLKKAIMMLNNIRTVQSNEGRRLLKSITKEKRDLLDCLELGKNKR